MPRLEHRTMQSVVISTAASGPTELVAAVTDNKIRVLSILLVSAGTVSVSFLSAATPKTGAMPCVANSGFAPGYNPGGWIETAEGEALSINLSDAVGVYGVLNYEVVGR